MSKKLLLGLILCVGLQVVNAAAAAPQQPQPTFKDHLNNARQDFITAGTHLQTALQNLGRAGGNLGLGVAHTVRALRTGALNSLDLAQKKPIHAFTIIGASSLSIHFIKQLPGAIIKQYGGYLGLIVLGAAFSKIIERILN